MAPHGNCIETSSRSTGADLASLRVASVSGTPTKWVFVGPGPERNALGQPARRM